MDRDRLFAASHSIAFGATCGVTMALAAAFSFVAARFGMLGGVAPDQLVLLRFLIANVFFFPSWCDGACSRLPVSAGRAA